jgi:hypothetical protein
MAGGSVTSDILVQFGGGNYDLITVVANTPFTNCHWFSSIDEGTSSVLDIQGQSGVLLDTITATQLQTVPSPEPAAWGLVLATLITGCIRFLFKYRRVAAFS